MFECGIGEQYASDDHSGFADDSGQSDAFIACQFISSHRFHRLSPRSIAGVDKWVMLGIGIVIWVIGAIMATAAFFSLKRGMRDDASGVDHIAEHERLRIASKTSSACFMPDSVRTSPTSFHIVFRRRFASASSSSVTKVGRWSSGRRAMAWRCRVAKLFSISTLTRAPKTSPSSRELLAKRFAP